MTTSPHRLLTFNRVVDFFLRDRDASLLRFPEEQLHLNLITMFTSLHFVVVLLKFFLSLHVDVLLSSQLIVVLSE